MSLGPGTRLGPYEIVAPLGAGGMGEVYKAKDTRLDRAVAVKVLPSHVSSDPALRERFEREARTIGALNHPHICTLHDVGHQDGIDFLVLEHLEGQTLVERLTKGALPIDQALQIAIHIADALDKAHRAGIVHRDLKPGNIMLTKSGAKLLDFGLAKVTPAVVAASGLSMAPTGPSPVTMQGTILGTLHYMAPEQIEGQEADARTDIFAFGAMLHEMVTGRKAFAGKTQASLIGAILKDEPPPPSTLQPITPPTLDRLIATCLSKDPDDRWQTARDLLRELRWIAEGRATALPVVARAGPRRERLALLFVSAVLIVVSALAGVLWAERVPAPAPRLVRFDIITPLSSDPSSFALSPDGRQLVFAALSDGATKLWVRSLDATTPRSIAGTDGASYPFWSPDSRSIAFFADGKLKRIDVSGGTPQVLADAPGGRGGTWNDDGLILFTPSQQQVDPTSVITRVSASGGSVTPVTHLAPGKGSHRWPQFLPDGRRFLFLSALGRADANGVYLGSLDGREPIRLMAADSAALFAPPKTLLVVRQGVLRAIPFDPDRGTITA